MLLLLTHESIFLLGMVSAHSSRGILTLVLLLVGHLGQHFIIIFITVHWMIKKNTTHAEMMLWLQIYCYTSGRKQTAFLSLRRSWKWKSCPFVPPKHVLRGFTAVNKLQLFILFIFSSWKHICGNWIKNGRWGNFQFSNLSFSSHSFPVQPSVSKWMKTFEICHFFLFCRHFFEGIQRLQSEMQRRQAASLILKGTQSKFRLFRLQIDVKWMNLNAHWCVSASAHSSLGC